MLFRSSPAIVANVPPNCFMPRPGVGSAVIHMTVHEKPPVFVEEEALLFALIRASFCQRRKTLFNGLKNLKGFDFTKEQIREAILALGVSENVRGEALSLEQFAQLSNALHRSL